MSDTVMITLDRLEDIALRLAGLIGTVSDRVDVSDARGSLDLATEEIDALRAALDSPSPEQSQVSSGLSEEDRERADAERDTALAKLKGAGDAGLPEDEHQWVRLDRHLELVAWERQKAADARSERDEARKALWDARCQHQDDAEDTGRLRNLLASDPAIQVFYEHFGIPFPELPKPSEAVARRLREAVNAALDAALADSEGEQRD